MENMQDLFTKCISKIEEFTDILKTMSDIKWNNETTKDFFIKQGIIANVNIVDEQFLKLWDSLNQFDYKGLNRELEYFLQQYLGIANSKYNEFNEPYKNYLTNYIKEIYNLLNQFFNALNNAKLIYNPFFALSKIYNALSNIHNSFNVNTNDLFEHFKYGKKNYVIFGKNGAGKTTLLKQIASTYFSSSVVVPANRKLASYNENSSIYFNPANKLNDILADEHSLSYLIEKIKEETLDAYDNGAKTNEVLKTRFYDIFSSLGLERSVIVRNKDLRLFSDNKIEYHINKASDGEKSVAYFIMATLLAPKDAYFFIDEPERHLNGSLMRKLFDKLELERSDLRFVYSTHIIDFVESRKNIELIYLEKTNAYNKWKFKKLKDYKDISLDIILSIEGIKDNIIFCEGNRDSIDCKILDCLFPQFEIKPVASCEQVKLNVKGINGLESLFRRKAFGVVDNDYMEEQEIDALKQDNIIAIGYNEWENFIIHSEILEYINSNFLNKDLAEIKYKVMAYIKCDGKNAILSDFLTKRFTKKIFATKLKWNENLENQINEINERNKCNILKEIKALEQQIDDYNDYDELVAIVPAKMLLKMVANEIGFKSDNDYIIYMVDHLKTDADFNAKVKNLLKINFDIL